MNINHHWKSFCKKAQPSECQSNNNVRRTLVLHAAIPGWILNTPHGPPSLAGVISEHRQSQEHSQVRKKKKTPSPQKAKPLKAPLLISLPPSISAKKKTLRKPKRQFQFHTIRLPEFQHRRFGGAGGPMEIEARLFLQRLEVHQGQGKGFQLKTGSYMTIKDPTFIWAL